MRLTVVNGSPRRRRSNTRTLCERFLEGFEESAGNTHEEHFVYSMESGAEAREIVRGAECVLLAFPLYVYSMPAGVMQLIERLEPLCGEEGNPPMAFFVQSGFVEAVHSRVLERYLGRLTELLGSEHLGTIIKGGCEGMGSRPPFLTRDTFESMREIGRSFGRTGRLDRRLLDEFSRPERFEGPGGWLKIRMHVAMANRMFWRKRLEEHGSLEKHGDRPYRASPPGQRRARDI